MIAADPESESLRWIGSWRSVEKGSCEVVRPRQKDRRLCEEVMMVVAHFISLIITNTIFWSLNSSQFRRRWPVVVIIYSFWNDPSVLLIKIPLSFLLKTCSSPSWRDRVAFFSNKFSQALITSIQHCFVCTQLFKRSAFRSNVKIIVYLPVMKTIFYHFWRIMAYKFRQIVVGERSMFDKSRDGVVIKTFPNRFKQNCYFVLEIHLFEIDHILGICKMLNHY